MVMPLPGASSASAVPAAPTMASAATPARRIVLELMSSLLLFGSCPMRSRPTWCGIFAGRANPAGVPAPCEPREKRMATLRLFDEKVEDDRNQEDQALRRAHPGPR